MDINIKIEELKNKAVNLRKEGWTYEKMIAFINKRREAGKLTGVDVARVHCLAYFVKVLEGGNPQEEQPVEPKETNRPDGGYFDGTLKGVV